MTFVSCDVVRLTLNTTITQNDVAFIVPGKTTLADVITKLGTPDAMTDSNTGVVAIYRLLDMRYSRINFGWLAETWSPAISVLIISRLALVPMRSNYSVTPIGL